jgi:hypothetical protein
MINLKNPSKSHRHKLRSIIEKGLKMEYELGLREAKKVIEQWENGEINEKESWFKIYKTITKRDKIIGKRYDLRGSQYVFIILSLLHDKLIKEDDLDELDREDKEQLIELKNRLTSR